MLQNLSLKHSKHFLQFIFFCLFLYIAIRAYAISFTHDESLTYSIITGDNDLKNTANNHLLNTFLSSVSKTLLGSKEFFLRLPNVLAFILYLYFTYKIISKKGIIILMLLGTSLLLFNSYLLDFFCLSRGYGLALGFSLASLYFLFERNSNTYKQYTTNLSLSLLFSVLAAYSNLMYINLNISIVIVFGIELLLLKQIKTIELDKKRILLLVSILIINILLISYLISWLFMLKDNNQLFYGGKNGFIENTIASLVQKSYAPSENINVIIISIVFLFAASTLYAIININKNLTAHSKSVLILVLMIAGTIIQHVFFDSLYPIFRTALAFILLFSLSIFYLFSDIYIKSKQNKILTVVNTIVLTTLTLLLSVTFYSTLNFIHTKEWAYDAHTKDVMMYIYKKNISKDTKQNITISNHWLFAPSINYYRDLLKMEYLTVPNRDGINYDSYYIYNMKNNLKTDSLKLNTGYKKIVEYEKTAFFEKKH